jgi:hypothetical protein
LCDTVFAQKWLSVADAAERISEMAQTPSVLQQMECEIPEDGGDSALERCLKNWLAGAYQQWSARETSFLIIDAQSVKNTDTAEEKRL